MTLRQPSRGVAARANRLAEAHRADRGPAGPLEQLGAPHLHVQPGPARRPALGLPATIEPDASGRLHSTVTTARVTLEPGRGWTSTLALRLTPTTVPRA